MSKLYHRIDQSGNFIFYRGYSESSYREYNIVNNFLMIFHLFDLGNSYRKFFLFNKDYDPYNDSEEPRRK